MKPPYRLLLLFSLIGFSLALILAYGALGAEAHVQDEQGYLLQAKIFSQLARTAPPPPEGVYVAEEFQQLWPQWYAVFSPGWPMILAIGTVFGLPHLVNPVLVALLPFLAWLAFSPHLSRRAALFACALSALSPGIWTLGASLMSHTWVLVCGLGALASISHPRHHPFWMGVGGLALGWMGLTRPLDMVLVGLPLVLWALWETLHRRLPALSMAALLVGSSLGPMGLAVDNYQLTGSAFTFPVDAYFERVLGETGRRYRPGCNRLGFGVDRGCLPRYQKNGYTPEMGAQNLMINAWHFDKLFIGIPGASLLYLIGAGLLLSRKQADPLQASMAVLVTVPVGYMLYWYHGVSFGARFWHPLYIGALPAAGLALDHMAGRITRYGNSLGWGLIILGSALTFPRIYTELSDDYWCVDAELASTLDIHEGTVLLLDIGSLEKSWPLSKFGGMTCEGIYSEASGLIHNDPIQPTDVRWLRAPETEAERQLLLPKLQGPIHLVTRNLGTGEIKVEVLE